MKKRKGTSRAKAAERPKEVNRTRGLKSPGDRRQGRGPRVEGGSSERGQSRRAPTKTSGETSGAGPALVTQKHGGALLAGGQPGHKGAGGRPRNEARELALAGYLENLPRLIRIAAGTETRNALDREGNLVKIQPTFRESKEAMTELGNRGVGKMLEIESPASPLVVTLMVGPEVAAERAREGGR